MNRIKSGFVCFAIGFVFLLGSAGFFGYNEWEDYNSGVAAASLLKDSESQLTINKESVINSDIAVAVPTVAKRVLQEEIVGIINIQAIKIHLSIFSKYSLELLKTSPCYYSGEAGDANKPPNHMIICGHNFKKHFGKIKDLHVGDIATYTNAYGKTYNLKVSEVIIIEADDFRTLEQGDWFLSIFTCTYGGKQRVVVRYKEIVE